MGREYNEAFLRDLSPDVDPCGENGEFHSFVYDGPIFQGPISVRVGEVVARDGRYYADLVPGTAEPVEKCDAGMFPPV